MLTVIYSLAIMTPAFAQRKLLMVALNSYPGSLLSSGY
jgi:hypothetical protein